MKTKIKITGKIVSIVLTICMIVTLFAGIELSPMTASAISATKMIHVDNNKLGYISYQWRPYELDAIQPNTDYRITFYWENISNASIFTDSMFYAKYYQVVGENGSWQPLFGIDDLSWGNATGKRLQLTDVAHGQLVTLDFTTPSDCRDYGSICFFFGDWNWALGNKSVIFNLAEIKFYTRSGDSLTPLNFADITANETLGTCTNSTPSSTRGRVIRNTTRGDGSEISFVDISSGYFDELVTYKVHFEKEQNNYSRYRFKIGYMTYPAGHYKCTMDCKIFGGSPLIRVTTNVDADGNAYELSGDQQNYTATYDPVNYKYTITFDTASDLSTPFGLIVGNYGHTGNFVFANPTLYRVDSDGNPLSYNYIKPLISANYNGTTHASGKWAQNGNYVSSTLTSHYFDPDNTANYVAHFSPGQNNYQVLVYKDTGIRLNSGETYRLMVDVDANNAGSTGNPSVIFKNGSYDSDTVLGDYTVSGITRTYDFTLEHNSNAGYQIMLGNYGNGTDVEVAFKNLRLYKIENGEIAGSNMVAPFKADNYEERDYSINRTNANSGKYTPVNCNDARIQCGVDDGTYFGSKMIHIPAGSDRYPGIVYKGGALDANSKFKFTMDECTKGGVPTTVSLFYYANGNYNNAIGPTTDKLDGTTREMIFQVYTGRSEFILQISNTYASSRLDSYCKNPKLFKLDSSGNITGNNLIADFTAANVSLTTSGVRANAAVGRWTTINYTAGYVVKENITGTAFELVYLGGDYNADGVADIRDYVIYKNVRAGNSFTGLSQDCDSSGYVDNRDFSALRDTVMA